MTLISSEDSAHDFIVKFSPSVCVAVVASLTREVAVRSFAYHAHGTNLAVIHGHDKILSQHPDDKSSYQFSQCRVLCHLRSNSLMFGPVKSQWITSHA